MVWQDWELIDKRRMQSPLAAMAAEAASKVDAARAQGQQTGKQVDKVAHSWAASQQLQLEVDAAIDAENAGTKLSDTQKAKVDGEAAMNVEGWECVSEHALAQEYLETQRNKEGGMGA